MKLIVSTLIFSGIYTIIRLTLNPPENLISFLIGLLVTSAIFFLALHFIIQCRRKKQ